MYEFLGGKLEENSEEISSVALLSPACSSHFFRRDFPGKSSISCQIYSIVFVTIFGQLIFLRVGFFPTWSFQLGFLSHTWSTQLLLTCCSACAVCADMVCVKTWYLCRHGVCFDMVSVQTRCVCRHGVFADMVCVKTWCVSRHGVRADMMSVQTWCVCRHGVCADMVWVQI